MASNENRQAFNGNSCQVVRRELKPFYQVVIAGCQNDTVPAYADGFNDGCISVRRSNRRYSTGHCLQEMCYLPLSVMRVKRLPSVTILDENAGRANALQLANGSHRRTVWPHWSSVSRREDGDDKMASG